MNKVIFKPCITKTKYIYKACKTNATMKYTKDKEYEGEFVTSTYSTILLIKNDVGDSVLVNKIDFDYIRKEEDIINGE